MDGVWPGRAHRREANHMKEISVLISRKQLDEATLNNIIDMGLTFSAMIRLFDEDTKKKLHERLIKTAKSIFGAKSEEEFRKIHSQFCEWGTGNIRLAKEAKPPRYGQIAKTLDVVLKVAVYCCRLPDPHKSKQLCEWLNAAVDTKMMAMLKRCYPEAIKPWPKTIKNVEDYDSYNSIQETVRKFIREKHQDCIIPVEFDVYYWWKPNRDRLQPVEC